MTSSRTRRVATRVGIVIGSATLALTTALTATAQARPSYAGSCSGDGGDHTFSGRVYYQNVSGYHQWETLYTAFGGPGATENTNRFGFGIKENGVTKYEWGSPHNRIKGRAYIDEIDSSTAPGYQRVRTYGGYSEALIFYPTFAEDLQPDDHCDQNNGYLVITV